MDITALRYFATAARHGNFTHAANALHITQPSLSQRIGRLEDDLGVLLFDRIGRGVRLTETGRRLLDHAEPIIAAVDTAERAMQTSGIDEGGRLVIGAIPTIAAYLLPRLIHDFVTAHPNVEFALYEGVTDELAAKTARGELDLALVSLPLDHQQLRVEPLLEEPFLVALPRNHPLVERDSIRPEQLSAERMVMLHGGQSLGRQTLEFCHYHRFEPDVAGHAAQLNTLLALVASGLGVSLVPRMASAEWTGDRVVYRPIRGRQPRRSLGVIRHRHRSRHPLAERFEEELAAAIPSDA